METDSIYTGLQKPSEDVYSTVNQPQGRRAGEQHGVPPVEPTSQSRVTIALGVTVGVLLLAMIVMGTAIGLQVHHNHSSSQSTSPACLENYNDVITRELSKYKKGLRQRLCGDPNTGKEVESCAVCLDGWRKGYNGSCYFLSTERSSWDFANKSCSKLGAHLAVIENKEELDTIDRAIPSNSIYWIGLRRKDPHWLWVDGTQLDEKISVSTQHREYHCASVYGSHVYAQSCNRDYPWICEQDAVRF
ncbi:C-type lectin domain family 7 member A-like [Polyodon spathula]|uniref:C-type lectin domain family 7 member A-like n=1 Tax=Polyodon spathula TaxID=7913 RepID=UPI001B7D9C87|nr:C-type lectin domain family 7 member A-like [Polyodon spathula]